MPEGYLATNIMGMTGGFDPSVPDPRNIGSEADNTWQTIWNLAPGRARATGQFGPEYAGFSGNIVSQLGPKFLQALLAMNPGGTSILNNLTSQAGSDLALGSSLDPTQTRLAQQSVRQNAASRGMGWGPSDVFNEAFALTDRGRQLQQQRRGFAGDVFNMNQSMTMPAFGAATSTAGSTMDQMSKQFDPFSPYAADLYNTNYNASAAANIAAANNRVAASTSYPSL